MKQIQFTEYGSYDKLHIAESALPEPVDGQVLVRLTYASVNPVDNTLRQGGILPPVTFPKILGNEGVGIIEKGNAALPKGTRVIISCMTAAGKIRGIATNGSWQEYLAVDPSELLPVPDSIDDATAAAFPVGFLSAYICLEKAEFTPGKRVLAIAGGGAVGNATIQLAKAMGASQVITTAGSPEKAAALTGAGITNIIDLSRETIVQGVNRLTEGKGVDIVVDMVGGKITGDALQSLAKNGILVTIGYAGNVEFTARITDFVWKAIQMRGVSLSGWTDPAEHKKAYNYLLPLLESGQIKPPVAKIFSAEDVAAANQYLIEEKPFGKVLLSF